MCLHLKEGGARTWLKDSWKHIPKKQKQKTKKIFLLWCSWLVSRGHCLDILLALPMYIHPIAYHILFTIYTCGLIFFLFKLLHWYFNFQRFFMFVAYEKRRWWINQRKSKKRSSEMQKAQFILRIHMWNDEWRICKEQKRRYACDE